MGERERERERETQNERELLSAPLSKGKEQEGGGRERKCEKDG